MMLNEQATARRDALAERLFEAAMGTADVLSIYLGDQLGLYEALRDGGSMTAAQLAEATGTARRYVREWLEHQAATGIIDAEESGDGYPTDSEAAAETRRFTLAPEHAEVLIDRDSLSSLAGLLRLTVGVSQTIQPVMQAYKTGEGVPYPDFGLDTRQGIAEMNRPMFLHLLGQDWFPSIPEIHERLQDDPPARVLDTGCGTGWSSIAIAKAYPNVTVHGFDSDEASIATARANAEAAGLGDRVTFAVRDASRPGIAGKFDLVTAFETVHDMGRPVAALAWMRELLTEGGVVLVADERVSEGFTAPADPIDRLNYGFSALHCLPATIAESDEAATGTVMRPSTLRRYAREAGFGTVEVAPVDHDFWRFYVLRP